MTSKTLIATLVAGALAFGGAAFAQQSHGGHHGSMSPGSMSPGSMSSGSMSSASPAAASPATAGYKAANEKMHKDMDVAFTGDADADFVRGMIPHHQGAIDMARVVLANGKDPEIRKLAEGIIADQEKEIALMRAWLTKNGK